MQEKTYFPLIDFLRFFAALSVMGFHYFSTYLKPDNIISIWLKYGYLGVELFFIISGFVIYFSLQTNLKDYFLGRFLRLYPLFWIIASFTYITTLIFDKYNNTIEALSFPKYLFNLLIINNGKTVNMIDGSYWTLTIEILFYIYIGIFVYLFKKKNLLNFYFLWLTATFLIFTFNMQELFISKLALVRYSPYFVFGGVMGFMYKNYNNSKKGLESGTEVTKNNFENIKSYILLISAFLMPHYINLKLHQYPTVSNNFGNFDFYATVIILLIFPISILAVIFSKYITHKRYLSIFMTLGAVTYPLYLLHQKVGSLFINLFTKNTGYGKISFFSISVAICIIIISTIIAKYEKVLRRKIKNHITN